MTLDDVMKAVAAIRAVAADDELAHAMEDGLRADFIAHVAQVAGGELADMAREVLKTDEIEFSRWHA